MTGESLHFIRQMQKQYREKFGEELYIDMLRMKGISVRHYNYDIKAMQECLDKLQKKHKAKIENIKNRRSILGEEFIPEQKLLYDYCTAIQENYWNPKTALELVGRDRSIYYYYRTYKIQKIKPIVDSLSRP